MHTTEARVRSMAVMRHFMLFACVSLCGARATYKIGLQRRNRHRASADARPTTPCRATREGRMSASALLRFLELVARDLGADDARAELGGRAPVGPGHVFT